VRPSRVQIPEPPHLTTLSEVPGREDRTRYTAQGCSSGCNCPSSRTPQRLVHALARVLHLKRGHVGVTLGCRHPGMAKNLLHYADMHPCAISSVAAVCRASWTLASRTCAWRRIAFHAHPSGCAWSWTPLCHRRPVRDGSAWCLCGRITRFESSLLGFCSYRVKHYTAQLCQVKCVMK